MSLWVPCKSASAASPVIKAGSSLGHVSDGDEKPGCILKWQHRHQSLPPVLGPGGFQTASCSLKILHPVGGPITAVSPHPSIHALVEFITSQESPDFWLVAPLNLNLFRYLVYLTFSSNPEEKKKKTYSLETGTTIRGTRNMTPRYLFPEAHSPLIGDDMAAVLSET